MTDIFPTPFPHNGTQLEKETQVNSAFQFTMKHAKKRGGGGEMEISQTLLKLTHIPGQFSRFFFFLNQPFLNT